MRRFTLIFVALLIGCNHSNEPMQPATRRTTTTATTATRAILKAIELHYGIYLARIDERITVSPDGTLHSVRTDDKTYGNNDMDPRNERVEVRAGVLTAEQMADLARLFANWDSLSSKPYPGVPDGGDISIRYGDKTVSGGSMVPKPVTDIHLRLRELAQSMPVVKH